MPPLTQNEYLAGAQAKVIPGRANEQAINAIGRTLVPMIDMTPQASICEWEDARIDLVATASPVFTLPRNAFDETTSYRFIGIRELTNPGTSVWRVRVEYPGQAEPMQEAFQVNTAQNNNMLTTPIGATQQLAQRNGRPLIVYPEGQLSVSINGTFQPGDAFRLSILRTIEGGCGRSSRLPGMITTSEV